MLIKLKDYKTIGMVMDFLCANDLNYETVQESSQSEIGTIVYKDVNCSCGACPTIFEFINAINNHNLYFRLRHGGWRLVDETESKTLVSGNANWLGLDGSCDFDEACKLIAKEGIMLLSVDEIEHIK